MNLKLEIALMFLGGLIRLLAIASNIWYLISQNINSTELRYVAISSLVAPTAIMLVFYSIVLVVECAKKELTSERIWIILLFVVGDSIGLNYFVFTFILCYSNILSGDFYVIDSMFRSAALFNSLFQSMPQIVYQVYNNQLINSWGVFTIFSVGISSVSLVYTITKLVYSIDKVRQFDKVMNLGGSTEVRTSNSVKKSEGAIIISTDNQNEDEVYNQSI